MGVKQQILGITGVAVRPVLASGDAPGGHPTQQTPVGYCWPVRRPLQAGNAYQAPLGLYYPRIPEDSHSHSNTIIGVAYCFVEGTLTALGLERQQGRRLE